MSRSIVTTVAAEMQPTSAGALWCCTDTTTVDGEYLDSRNVEPLPTDDAVRLDGSDGNILIGGAGNALQIGGRGRSLLVAGFGSERLVEEALGDTSLDAALEASAGDEAFQSIMAGWHASDNFADRVANLLGKTAPPAGNDNPRTRVEDEIPTEPNAAGVQDWSFLVVSDAARDRHIEDVLSNVALSNCAPPAEEEGD